MPEYLRLVREKVGNLPLILTAALGIIPFQGKFVFVETASGSIQLPGGMPELEETIEETLLREVQEETGLSTEIEYFLGVYTNRPLDTYSNGDQAKVYLFIFVCKEASGELQSHDPEIRNVVLKELREVPRYKDIVEDYLSGGRGYVR